MVKKYEQEALARSLISITALDLTKAREAVNKTLPELLNYYQQANPTHAQDYTIENIKPDRNNVPWILMHAAKNGGIKPNENLAKAINSRFMNTKGFRDNYTAVKNQVYDEQTRRYAKMGPELIGALAPYVDSQKMRDIQQVYRGKNIQFDPSKRYPGDKQKMARYQDYLLGVKRASNILNYLNDHHINMTIDNDDDNASQLVAKLPEYGNMKVTIMANDSRKIGEVNTWDNQYGYNRKWNPKNKTYDYDIDPRNFSSAIIVDTLLNPSSTVKDLDKLSSRGTTKNTIISRANVRAYGADGKPLVNKEGKPMGISQINFFVSSQSRHLQSMKSFIEKIAEKDKDKNATKGMMDEVKEFMDDNGIETDTNDLDISQDDKNHEYAQRARNDWVPINVDTVDSNGKVVETAKEKIEKEHHRHGMFQTIYNQAHELGFENVIVSRNSKGVYRYDYKLKKPGSKRMNSSYGIIGGYIPPQKDGTFKLEYNGKVKGYSVPGMRAYIDTQTGDLRVKKFGNIIRERVRKTMIDEVNNPRLRDSVKAYTALDSLYTTDGYATVIKEKGKNSPEYESALIKTLQKRIRLSNDVLANANALNENADHVKQNEKRMEYSPQNSRNAMLEHENLRTIPTKWQKYVDREMTGIGKTMGASLFLGDNVKILPDGSLEANDNEPHTKSLLHNQDVFQWDKYDPADRNIMAFNQAIRNVPMDQVNVAMMTMSGWTENDACAVTAKYANDQKHWVKDHETGKLRPLKAGDKITDLHGNKSTISLVIDPNDKNPETQKLYAREEAIVRANPELDVIINPYSSISRLNAGSAREMQDRGGMTYLKTPPEYPNIDLSHITMGKETYAICEDQAVDKKTVVYDKEMYEKGKARHISHQGAAAMASADLPNTLTSIYHNNPNLGWGKYFDDLHLLGYDIDKNHNVGQFDYNRKDAVIIHLPDKQTIDKTLQYPERIRHASPTQGGRDDFDQKLAMAYKQALKNHAPVLMEVPGEYTDKSGQKTNKIVVPYQQMIADKRRAQIMGVQDNHSTSSWKNTLHRIYKYAAGIEPDSKGNLQIDKAMKEVNKLGSTVIKRDFGNNHNIIKDDIYSRPMPGSSTAVVTPDPTLDIDVVAFGEKAYKNLLKTDPKIADPTHPHKVVIFRDPQLRDGGFRAVYAVMQKRLTGIAWNPVNTKSMDADHDGDTLGAVPIPNEKAQQELEKMKPSNNLIDLATGSKNSFLETGLELTGSLHRQGLDYEREDLNRIDVDSDIARKVIKDGFDNDAAYGIGIDASSKASYFKSISALIESGAKGHCEKDQQGNVKHDKNGLVISKAMKQVEKYYDGKRTDQDMHDSMVALSVKADVVGSAGKSQQILLWPLRNINPKAAMDVTYNTTNGALQAKHDAEEAREREKQIVGPLPKVLNGIKPYANPYDPNPRISVKDFKDNLNRIYNTELGMDLASETIDSLAQSLNDGHGYIMDKQERLEKADPLDVMAYDSGSIISKLNNAMNNHKPICVGKYTQCFDMPEALCSDPDKVLKPVDQTKTKQKNVQQTQSMNQAQEPNQSMDNEKTDKDLKNEQNLPF